MRWLSILVVALALVAAGCGGSNDESAASDETTVEETTTSTDESTTDTSTTDTSISGVLGDKDCLALASAGAAFAQAVTGATDDEAAAAFEKLANDVPDEIKADVQTLADWYATYTAKLKDIGITAGQTPTAAQLQQLQTAISSDTSEVQAASQRLEAWSQENCTG